MTHKTKKKTSKKRRLPESEARAEETVALIFEAAWDGLDEELCEIEDRVRESAMYSGSFDAENKLAGIKLARKTVNAWFDWQTGRA